MAPAANRSRLWLNTEHYIDQLLEGLSSLPPADALRLAFELVWRLETALVPVFNDWITKLRPIIEAINPDPIRIDMPAAILRPDDIASSTLEWTTLRCMWVELSFAMAKEARNDQDSDRFVLWMTRLGEVAKLQKDWYARWVQEQCLHALGRLDYAAVRSHLASWPTDTISAFWGKKAAILAEIGHVPAANAAAEATLSAIRGRQQTAAGDIGLLSQEGWTMTLLRQLTLGARFGELRDDPAADRRDQLGAYRCNPWPEIQIQGGDVMRRRDPKQHRTTRRQFDPGRWTTSILFSRDEWDSVGAAFAFLRMLERGALPIRCGQTLIFPEPVTAAADTIWSAAAAPLLALSTRLRVGSSQDMDRTFDRSAIARLSDEQITFLLELTTTAIRQALQRMHSGEEGNPLQNASLITVCTEMLSRLAVCLSDDRIEELLQLAITLYRDPLPRGIGFQRSLNNLFHRIISALPQERIGMRAHDLAELPIPGVGGFEVQDSEGWTEPFASPGWPWHKIPVEGERQTWGPTIAWLTSVAATGAAGPRGRALIRLDRLYRLGVLTDSEIQRFGEALWARLHTIRHHVPIVGICRAAASV